jgi:hypothetical protein
VHDSIGGKPMTNILQTLDRLDFAWDREVSSDLAVVAVWAGVFSCRAACQPAEVALPPAAMQLPYVGRPHSAVDQARLGSNR